MYTDDPPPTRFELMKIALRARANCDENWPKGFVIWLPLQRIGGEWDYEFGPYLGWLWSWCVALKCCLCLLLHRDGVEQFHEDWIEVAAWDGEEHNGYPEANYHAWRYLKVCKGLRPRTWRYETGWEST
jgi:hypothetical protein